MLDTLFIHDFAMEYLQFYQNPATQEGKVEDYAFANQCAAFGFQMDAGESFKRRYPQSEVFYNAAALERIIGQIQDVAFLGTAIFSKWRYITHWSFGESLLSNENRAWFIVAFTRLVELTAPLSEASECILPHTDVLPPVFHGQLQRLKLCSDGAFFWTPPRIGEEVEQRVTVCRDGRVWFNGYNFKLGGTERGRRMQYRISPERAAYILDLFQQYFTGNYMDILACDAGIWHLTLTDENGEPFRFKGSMTGDLYMDNIGLSALLRRDLVIKDLWGFCGEASEYDDTRYLFCSVIFGEGQKSYAYIADDMSIAPGDFVVVPAGRENRLEVAKVVSASWHSKSDAPFPVDDTKHILRKCVVEDIALLWK